MTPASATSTSKYQELLLKAVESMCVDLLARCRDQPSPGSARTPPGGRHLAIKMTHNLKDQLHWGTQHIIALCSNNVRTVLMRLVLGLEC